MTINTAPWNRIVSQVQIDASVDEVWAYVRDIATHVEWMADAESITFTTPETHGVGAAFDCVTKIGPITLIDKMRVDSWDDGWAIGVSHHGLVTGVGEFKLAHDGSGTTTFTWTEALKFPWWLAGQLGFVVGGRWVLQAVWRRNLGRLRDHFDSVTNGRDETAS